MCRTDFAHIYFFHFIAFFLRTEVFKLLYHYILEELSLFIDKKVLHVSSYPCFAGKYFEIYKNPTTNDTSFKSSTKKLLESGKPDWTSDYHKKTHEIWLLA